MQGTWVQSFVQENPTGCRATKLCATREASAIRSPCTATRECPCSLQLERVHVQQDPAQPKIDITFFKKKEKKDKGHITDRSKKVFVWLCKLEDKHTYTQKKQAQKFSQQKRATWAASCWEHALSAWFTQVQREWWRLWACSAKRPCVHEIRMSTFDSCCQAVTVKQIMSVGGNCNISLSR